MKIEKNNAYLYKMLSYIETDESDGFKINIDDYEIKSFSVPNKLKLKNLFIVKDNKLLYDKTFYRNGIILNASALGSIEMLEWVINSGYEFKYDERAISNATFGNHIHILEWFKNSGYKLKYRNYAITQTNNHKIIKFFIENICVKKLLSMFLLFLILNL
jgi:hypothetical protein